MSRLAKGTQDRFGARKDMLGHSAATAENENDVNQVLCLYESQQI